MFLFSKDKNSWIEVESTSFDKDKNSCVLVIPNENNISLHLSNFVFKIGAYNTNSVNQQLQDKIKFRFHITDQTTAFDFGVTKAQSLKYFRDMLLSVETPKTESSQTSEEDVKHDSTQSGASFAIEISFQGSLYPVTVTTDELSRWSISDLKARIYFCLLSSSPSLEFSVDDICLFLEDIPLIAAWQCSDIVFHPFSRIHVKFMKDISLAQSQKIPPKPLFILHYKDIGVIEVNSFDKLEELVENFSNLHSLGQDDKISLFSELCKGMAKTCERELKEVTKHLFVKEAMKDKNSYQVDSEKIIKEAATQVYKLKQNNRKLLDKLLAIESIGLNQNLF